MKFSYCPRALMDELVICLIKQSVNNRKTVNKGKSNRIFRHLRNLLLPAFYLLVNQIFKSSRFRSYFMFTTVEKIVYFHPNCKGKKIQRKLVGAIKYYEHINNSQVITCACYMEVQMRISSCVNDMLIYSACNEASFHTLVFRLDRLHLVNICLYLLKLKKSRAVNEMSSKLQPEMDVNASFEANWYQKVKNWFVDLRIH